jgi:hypothetical protein
MFNVRNFTLTELRDDFKNSRVGCKIFCMQSEQVIPITVSQIERGIENPCADESIQALLLTFWFDSGFFG